MQDRSAVTVTESIYDLLEYELRLFLTKTLLSFHIMEQISSACIFHHDEEMLGRLKHLKKSDNIRMMDFLEDIDFLEDLLPREIVLDILLFESLDRH